MSNCSNTVLALRAGSTEEIETDGPAIVVVSSLLLFLLVFGMAGTVDFEAFTKKFKNAKGILIGVSSQFLLLPLIGFIVVKMLNGYFEDETLFAQILIIVVSSPGGSYSNWWCNLINADLALSVAMTTVSTLLAMGMLPLNVYLYATKALGSGDGFDLPWADLGRSLGIVIVAIMSGLAVGKKFPQYHPQINLLGNVSGLGLIVFGIAFASSGGADELFTKPTEMYVATGLPVIFGITLAASFAAAARLPKPERVAVAIETCYQNTGIAVAVAISFGTNPKIGADCAREAAAIPALYGMAEILIIGVFALLSWQLGYTYSPRTDNICKVLFSDYQHMSPDAAGNEGLSDAVASPKEKGEGVDWDKVAPSA